MSDRDVIARAFCKHMLKGRKPHSDGTPADERSWQHGSEAWIGHTEAFIAALADAGLVIVPSEPTEAMIQAWSDRTDSEGDCPCERKIAQNWRPEDYSKEWARVNAKADWRVMLTAAGGDNAD